MKYNTLLEKLRDYKKIKSELDVAEADYSSFLKNVEQRTERHFSALAVNINSFCGGESFRTIIKKFCYVYEGKLSVIKGYLAYGGRVLPARSFNYENASSVAEKCVADIKAAVQGITRNIGNTDLQIRTLCEGFSTLRSIYAKISMLKKDASETEIAQESERIEALKRSLSKLIKECPELEKPEEAESKLEELRSKLTSELDRFNFDNIPMSKNYGDAIEFPIGIRNAGDIENMELCYWNPFSDGVLCVSINEKETVNASYNFVKAVIMQFLHSYPGMDKQIFYCGNHSSSNMDIFLDALGDKENGVGVEIFYRSTQQLKSFKNQVTEYIDFLRDEIKERLKTLDYNGSDNIYDYNQTNKKDIKKPILVILHGYPYGFESCENLDYLFEAGKGVGIFCLVIKDEQKKENGYYERKPIQAEDYARLKCRLNKNEFLINDKEYEPVDISDDKRRALIRDLSKVKKDAAVSFISYDEVGFSAYEPPKSYSRISIPVGMAGKDVYNMNFVSNDDDGGNYPTGYFIIGVTKAGKSSLIDAMIINGAMAYSPDDLIFYLLDFKDGVSANAYLGANAIPHVRVVAQNNKEEDAHILLSNLLNEKESRNKRFIEMGNSVGKKIDDIASYNKHSSKHMPNIIVVIDECQALFKSEKLAHASEDLVRKGRSTGIFFVLSTQIYESSMRNVVSQLTGRACFLTDASNAQNIIVNQAYASRVPVELGQEKGSAFISDDSGNSCKKVRAAWHQKQTNELNRQIREKWMKQGYEIKLAVAGEKSPLYIEEACREQNKLCSEEGFAIPYGENYFDHTIEKINFTEESNHTVLLMGNDEKINTSILTSIMVGALRGRAKVKLIDESKDGQISRMFQSHPLVELKANEEYLELLSDAYQEYLYRSAHHREEHEPYFLVLHGLNHITAFTSNELVQAKSENVTSTSGYRDLRAAWENANKRINGDKTIRGKDTLYDLIARIGNAPNMYVVITGSNVIAEDSSDRKAFRGFDYKLLQANVGEMAVNLIEDSYNRNMMNDMNENMMFVSAEHSRLFKVRHYIYDFDKQEASRIIKEAVRGDRNEN